MNAERIEADSEQWSRSYRVLNTRVSDLARGEITGPFRRMSRRTMYVRVIASSELPDHPKDLIRHVTKRTRLWPSERTEVARELIAHFHEGLETGTSAQRLVQDFGELRTAARLIRRAKQRTRPVAWRAWNRSRQAVMALSLLLALAYTVLAARFFSGDPLITRDFIAELNVGVSDLPDQERAWPTYIASLEYLLEFPDELENSPWPEIGPDDEHWEAALAYNAQTQPGIALAIEAAQHTDLGLVVTDRTDPLLAGLFFRVHGLEIDDTPLDPNPPLISLRMEYLGYLQHVSRHLVFDARRAAHASDTSRVITDIKSLIGVACHVRQHPLLINRMVGDALHAQAARTARDILANHPANFADDQLITLAHLFASAPIHPLSPDEINAQRMWFDDFLQRLYTDDGRGGGRLTPEGVYAMRLSQPQQPTIGAQTLGSRVLAPMLTLSSRRQDAVAEFDRLMSDSLAEVAPPIWERTASAIQADLHATSDRDRSVYAPRPARVFFPPIQAAATAVERAAQELDVTSIAIALELFRRKNERFPATLDELVPLHLPRVPTDRFDGQPMRYALAEAGPIVYSVGADLDDDGGRQPANDPDRISVWPASITVWYPADYLQRPIPSGDWVLYAPDAD